MSWPFCHTHTMQRTMKVNLVAPLLLVASACSTPVEAPPDTTLPLPVQTTGTTPDPTTTAAQQLPVGSPDTELAGCFGDGPPLEQEGFMGRFEAPDSDAQTISAIGWTESENCAAVTISFQTNQGAPAVEPPTVRAEYLRHTGVIRLDMDQAISTSGVSHQVIDTPLIRSLYVATDPIGANLVADLHLWAGALARVQTFSAPARIVIELERGGPELIQQARAGAQAVVFFPEQDEAPIVLEGYGTPGSELEIRVSSAEVENTRTVAVEPSATLWTLFSVTLTEIEAGLVEVAVGDAPTFVFTTR